MRWRGHLDAGRWSYSQHEFWTTPFPFWWMQQVAPDLHDLLAGSSLIVFKGDLNYRKLAYDCRWPYTTPFPQALGPFRPAPLVTLRTLKADVIAGACLTAHRTGAVLRDGGLLGLRRGYGREGCSWEGGARGVCRSWKAIFQAEPCPAAQVWPPAKVRLWQRWTATGWSMVALAWFSLLTHNRRSWCESPAGARDTCNTAPSLHVHAHRRL